MPLSRNGGAKVSIFPNETEFKGTFPAFFNVSIKSFPHRACLH